MLPTCPLLRASPRGDSPLLSGPAVAQKRGPSLTVPAEDSGREDQDTAASGHQRPHSPTRRGTASHSTHALHISSCHHCSGNLAHFHFSLCFWVRLATSVIKKAVSSLPGAPPGGTCSSPHCRDKAHSPKPPRLRAPGTPVTWMRFSSTTGPCWRSRTIVACTTFRKATS